MKKPRMNPMLPSGWNGLMRLSLDSAAAYWTPTTHEPIDLGATVFTNAQLPKTIYLKGNGCGTGQASFSVVGLSDCKTNLALSIFGMNATLAGVAETDELAPGGFLADRSVHTNAPRTALTLEAFGPVAATGNVVLTWNSSVVQIYTTAAGGSPLAQFSRPYNGFTTTTLYVEGIAPGSNTLSWTYSVQTNCVDNIVITIIKVDTIEVLNSSATMIGDGAAIPLNTDICASIKDTGEVLLQAKLQPNISESDLPSGFISWTGGEPVAGHLLQRKVSKSTWSKTEVKVYCGGSAEPAYTMIVYIIGAEANGTKRDGTSFSDNSQAVSTGMHEPTGSSGAYENNIEIEFSIKPDVLFADAVAGIFDTSYIQWDVSRDKRVRYWKRDSGTWVLFDDRGTTWASDDSHDAEEDNNPWDGNGHIYGNDTPGWVGQGDWLVSKLNMREWVRVGLGGVSGRNGTICSEYHYWRAFRSIRETPPVWVNENLYDNELEDGTAFWGSVPPVP